MKNFGFHADVHSFEKTVRLVSGYCGIESRACWVECIFCDGIGPTKTYDWIFKGQSMFWIFRIVNERNEVKYVARERKFGGLFYVDVKQFGCD